LISVLNKLLLGKFSLADAYVEKLQKHSPLNGIFELRKFTFLKMVEEFTKFREGGLPVDERIKERVLSICKSEDNVLVDSLPKRLKKKLMSLID